MKKIKIIYIFILVVFIFSCKKKSEDPQQNCEKSYLSSSLSPLIFNVGSIWVYKSNEKIDTIKLTSVKQDFTPCVKGNNPQETFTSFYSSSFNHNTYWDEYIGYVIVRNGKYWGNDGQYIYLSSHKIGDTSGGAVIDKIYDTLNVSGNSYKNVVRVSVLKDKFENNQKVQYYYCDNIGLIRKEFFEADSISLQWNLVYKNFK